MLVIQSKQKTDYDVKNGAIEKKPADHNHDKYSTIPELNRFTAEIFPARLGQANLVTKTDFNTKIKSLNQNIDSNKAKHLPVKNELKNLQTIISIYFRDKSHFEEDGAQNYLIFQPMYRYFKKIICVDNGECIYFWRSKGLHEKRINSITASNYKIKSKIQWKLFKTR